MIRADINKEIDQNNRWPHQWVFSKVLSFKKTCRAEIYEARKKIITPRLKLEHRRKLYTRENQDSAPR